MTGVIHTLLLVAVTVGPGDSPPAKASDAAAPQEVPPVAPPPCVPVPTPTPTPAPEETHRPRRIVVDESLAPGVPDEEAPDVGWLQASHDLLERGINALVLRL